MSFPEGGLPVPKKCIVQIRKNDLFSTITCMYKEII
jgi:hypothetical protein